MPKVSPCRTYGIHHCFSCLHWHLWQGVRGFSCTWMRGCLLFRRRKRGHGVLPLLQGHPALSHKLSCPSKYALCCYSYCFPTGRFRQQGRTTPDSTSTLSSNT